MKKLLLLFILLGFCFSNVYAQHQEISENRTEKNEDLKNVYLGLGTGINNVNAIIGLSLNIRVYDRFFLRGGAGLGAWGTKLTGGLRYDMGYDKGWFFSGTFSSCSGVSGLKLNMELANGNTQEIEIDYLRANVLNLTVGHNWKIGRSNTFYMEFGYAVPLSSEPWLINDNVVISDVSKYALKFTQPGGLIIGLGLTFGL